MKKVVEPIAQWTDRSNRSFTTRERQILLGVLAIGTAVMLSIAIWLDDLSLYLAAAVFVAIGISIAVQKKTSPKLTVSLFYDHLEVGTSNYPISDLAGFWLQKISGKLYLQIENKRSFLPISLEYPTLNSSKLRQEFLEVLPELEPRPTTFNDQIAAWLKL